jgi:acyl-CoA oxidase
MFQYYPHQALAMEQETDFIPDLPEGPLSIYRKQASFDWKKLKLVFDKPEILKVKVRTV